jgi:sulfur-carrier protein
MNIKVLYFARIKESVNYSTENVLLPDDVKTIADLKNYLAQRGDVWTDLFSKQQAIRAAINHELVNNIAVIRDGDEVAFFPPVTGG